MGVGGSKSKTAKAAEEGGGSAPRAALEAPAAKYAKMPAAAAAVAADRELPEEGHGFEYDLIVIGGGSGGLAASKQAAKYGKKVGKALRPLSRLSAKCEVRWRQPAGRSAVRGAHKSDAGAVTDATAALGGPLPRHLFACAAIAAAVRRWRCWTL